MSTQALQKLLRTWGPGPVGWGLWGLGCAVLAAATAAVLLCTWTLAAFLLAPEQTAQLLPSWMAHPPGWLPLDWPTERLWLLLLGGWTLALLFWYGWFFLLQRAAARQAQKFAAQLRQQIYLHAFQLGDPLLYAGDLDSAPLVRLFDKTVEQCRQGARGVWATLLPLGTVAVVLVAAGLWIHLWATLAILALSALLLVLWQGFQQRAGQQELLCRDRAARQMTLLQETLQLARVVNTLLLDDPPGVPFADSLRQLDQYQLECDRVRLSRWIRLRLGLLAAGAFALALVGYHALAGRGGALGLPQMVVLAVALGWAYAITRRWLRQWRELPQADQAAQQVLDFLSQPPCVSQAPEAQEVPQLQNQIRYEDMVLVDATGKRVLDRFTATVPRGQLVAVVSPQPRSALALGSTLARLCDPTAGAIYWDSLDLKNASLDSLRKRLGLVFQHDLVFTGTVMENILCNDPHFSPEDVRGLAKRLGLTPWLDRLPQGWETMVGRLGNWLHPLEAHFVGLLRTLLRGPEVLFIEEPWEEAETELEQLWENTLGEILPGRTVIVVAHRLSTLRRADQVLLLDAGSVVAQGTHAQLVQSSHLYRHLLYIWFNQFREKDQVPVGAEK